MRHQRNQSLITGSITGGILSFTVPLIMGNLFQQLYNTTDSLIVGNMAQNIGAKKPIASKRVFYLLVDRQSLRHSSGIFTVFLQPYSFKPFFSGRRSGSLRNYDGKSAWSQLFPFEHLQHTHRHVTGFRRLLQYHVFVCSEPVWCKSSVAGDHDSPFSVHLYPLPGVSHYLGTDCRCHRNTLLHGHLAPCETISNVKLVCLHLQASALISVTDSRNQGCLFY